MLGLGLPARRCCWARALAPTDPVLAADVQVGPPGTGEEDEVRFALTSEAGLNDGLAFPFVNLAIAIAAVRRRPAERLGLPAGSRRTWSGSSAAGVAVGWLVGPRSAS